MPRRQQHQHVPSGAQCSNLRELAAVGDDDRLGGLAGLAADGLDGLHDLHTCGERDGSQFRARENNRRGRARRLKLRATAREAHPWRPCRTRRACRRATRSGRCRGRTGSLGRGHEEDREAKSFSFDFFQGDDAAACRGRWSRHHRAPLVFGPALAMERMPGPVCCSGGGKGDGQRQQPSVEQIARASRSERGLTGPQRDETRFARPQQPGAAEANLEGEVLIRELGAVDRLACDEDADTSETAMGVRGCRARRPRRRSRAGRLPQVQNP